jgi:hypothetical protein
MLDMITEGKKETIPGEEKKEQFLELGEIELKYIPPGNGEVGS